MDRVDQGPEVEARAADEDRRATLGGEAVEHVDTGRLVVGHGELRLGFDQVEQVVADPGPLSDIGLAVPMSIPR